MRATALLHRLPHPADTERRRHSRRHARKRADATRTTELHVLEPDPRHDPKVLRVRSAGGPIDNASYTCACGFVFAASVSTTVRCPHCGADQAW
jgi:predicted Zn-ribbon and HTH transcriptional regulator